MSEASVEKAKEKPIEKVLCSRYSYPLCHNSLGWFISGPDKAHFFICTRHREERTWMMQENDDILVICPSCESELNLNKKLRENERRIEKERILKKIEKEIPPEETLTDFLSGYKAGLEKAGKILQVSDKS